MPGNQINSDSKMEALEIEEEIADAVLAVGPDGLSFKDGCEIIGMDYDRFYLLVHQLVQLGRLKVERGRSGNQNRIFLPHQQAPANSTITEKQREVLDLLISEMDDDGLTVLSYKQIERRTQARCPAFILDRLDYKGFLEIVDRGGPYANIYRVYPKQDGPRGYSPMVAKP